MKSLKEKILSHEARVAVVGLGYVGLPLACAFASKGYHVTGIDLSESKVESLKKGDSYIIDVKSETLKSLVNEGRFTPTTDFAALRNVDCISICVPTPLAKTGEPDVSYMINARDYILPHLQKGTLFVLESTTYPGSTRELMIKPLQKAGFELGKDVFVAFSPERVDPGNPKYNTLNTPKVVGGATSECTELAVALYSSIIPMIVPVSSCEAAEMTKLLENTFRSINIGLVNEIAIMCKYLGIDVWEVIKAASSKPFGFMPFYPGPGIGGHCIPIDPLYLSWKLRTLHYKARFIELADDINSAMPDYVVGLIGEALNEHKKSIKGSKILLLGMAYKKDIDDLRESPSLLVYDRLRQKGAELYYHDPFIKSFRYNDETITGVGGENMGQYDCIVVLTNHSCFDYDAIAKSAQLIVDTRNATKDIADRSNIVTL